MKIPFINMPASAPKCHRCSWVPVAGMQGGNLRPVEAGATGELICTVCLWHLHDKMGIEVVDHELLRESRVRPPA